MNLYQLVYKSYATLEPKAEDLADILVEARVNNVKLNVTGNLVYKSGAFMQVLEGDKAVVWSLFGSIKRDKRHTHVELMYFEPARQRTFPKWSMNIINLDYQALGDMKALRVLIHQMKNHDGEDNNTQLAKRLIDVFNQ